MKPLPISTRSDFADKRQSMTIHDETISRYLKWMWNAESGLWAWRMQVSRRLLPLTSAQRCFPKQCDLASTPVARQVIKKKRVHTWHAMIVQICVDGIDTFWIEGRNAFIFQDDIVSPASIRPRGLSRIVEPLHPYSTILQDEYDKTWYHLPLHG